VAALLLSGVSHSYPPAIHLRTRAPVRYPWPMATPLWFETVDKGAGGVDLVEELSKLADLKQQVRAAVSLRTEAR
jgi:hypothetical protein